MPRDFYSILRVSQTASVKEIKASYRKLALKFHPDTHEGDPSKTAEFRRISEAYATLSNQDKRNSYDFKNGFRYNKNRRTAPPPNYRSVKWTEPPPEWKGKVWDHEAHHDMHYGDGLYKEIIKQAKKEMKKEGSLEYESVLGKGFTFSKEDPTQNYNPYSKSSQGPPTVEFVFEESFGNINDYMARQKAQKDGLYHKKVVVENLHGKREQRRQQSTRSKTEKQRPKEKAKPRKRENKAFQKQDESCVIM